MTPKTTTNKQTSNFNLLYFSFGADFLFPLFRGLGGFLRSWTAELGEETLGCHTVQVSVCVCKCVCDIANDYHCVRYKQNRFDIWNTFVSDLLDSF